MCQNDKNFILCTCLEDKTNNSNNETFKYEWHLIRFVKRKDSRIIGKVVVPSEDIGNGLTNQYVAEQLNSKNCFDFNYEPQELDTLKINLKSQPYHPYLEFSYINGTWVFGKHYDPFNDVMTEMSHGKLKEL